MTICEPRSNPKQSEFINFGRGCDHAERIDRTVTTTIHKYTTKLPQTTTATTTVTTSRIRGNTSASATPGLNQTIVYGPVPAFATAQCPEAGQFASACRCWASVSTRTMAVSASTVTTTTTAWHNVGCGPAATAVGSKSSFFPCSRQWGTCSCLKSGVQDICVRIGPFLGEGRNMTGPCADFDECDAEGGCKDGFACVYDGSCKCGKRRCYKAAPNGCDYQGLPIDDFKKRL